MRIRITFSKSGPLIYIGNLDLYTLWERTARRAELPLAYSQGFHPQPKLHFASPLPLGFSSRCELMDMKLSEEVDLGGLPERLNAALPGGVRVLSIQEIEESEPALQTLVTAAEYEVRLRDEAAAQSLEERARQVLQAASLPRERRNKHYDLRPLIEDLEVHAPDETGEKRLTMRLRAKEGATGRPDEVLEELGVSREHARIERTRLWLRAEVDEGAERAGRS